MISRLGWAAILTVVGTTLGFGPAVAQSAAPAGISSEARTDSLPSVEELALWAEQDGGAERVREAILTRIAALPGREATIWVQLLSVVEQVDASAAPEAIRAVGMGMESKGLSGSEVVMRGLGAVPVADRALLLALAAHLAEMEDAGRAGEIRARLLEEYPDAPEATEVRLLQAGWFLGGGDRMEDGMRLLEELIVGAPQHPLAPEARRLYEAHGGRDGPNPRGDRP